MRSNKKYFFLILISVFAFGKGKAADADHVSREIAWTVNINGEYLPYDQHENTQTVYFTIEPGKYRNAYLRIRSERNFYIFANKKLILKGKNELLINLDSLSKKHPGNLSVAIHQRNVIYDLNTKIILPQLIRDDTPLPRKQDSFLNFSIIASIFVLIAFTALFRSTPQLTLDYFNVIKLLSLQDRDENQFPLRITAAANLLFYIFCSFLSALLLLTVFHFAKGSIPISKYFLMDTTAQCFLQWILLSVIVFTFLTIKLVLLVLLSALYSFRDAVNFQFFNFVRLLLVSATTLLLLAAVYFIFHAMESEYFFKLLIILSWMLSGGVLILYLKLMRRMPYRFFHLFSYLCVSEIVPLMILIKLFFN